MFRKVALIVTLAALALLSHVACAGVQEDFIASGRQNNILSDQVFLDTRSMTIGEVQAFLTLKGSFLKDYVDNSVEGRGRSAAQIIWDAAQGKYEAGGTWNGIVINESTGSVSPKIILVYLQKEQSLVTRSVWSDWAMTASMGYYCYAGVTGDYNNNNVKDIYEGFTKQVENGAWQLRYNYEAATKDDSWWNAHYGTSHYQVGQAFHTSDGYDVVLSNRATSSVYRYTPYVFWSAYNVVNIYDTYFDPSKSLLVEFIVTKVLSDGWVMIEDQNRTRGIKLHSPISLLAGDKVDARGTITTVDGQKLISAPDEVAKVSSGNALPRYLATHEKNLVEACNGRGCPISGLRVTTWGRVVRTPTRVDPYVGYYFILLDDGTEVYNPQDHSIGYRVYYKASDFPDLDRELVEGDFCLIRGVVESVGHTTIPALANNLPIIWADSIEKQ